MNIGIIGLGKLGLPVAVSLATKHTVYGYDLNPALMKKRQYEHVEAGPTSKDDFQYWFNEANLTFVSYQEVVEKSEIIFVAIQTPHQPKYEGITRVPDERANFNYDYLKKSITDIVKHTRPDQIVAIISTVLPGTVREHLIPIIKDKAKLVYTPLFIAMSTVMYDYMHPEFVLLGADDKEAAQTMHNFFNDFYGRDLVQEMTIESAELTKVAYNTYLGAKIGIANMLMEICHKIPNTNIDSIYNALSQATDRVVSSKYMKGGMGDGGACHPRDLIAMSWLAQKLNLSHDLFDDIMKARERQAEWLVGMMLEHHSLPKVILGLSYKPGVNITTGSAAVLCVNLLKEHHIPCITWDPYIDKIPFSDSMANRPSVFLIGTKHGQFAKIKFPTGSVVIDPHRYIKDQLGVKVIKVGIGM